jgi:hypothetical protein
MQSFIQTLFYETIHLFKEKEAISVLRQPLFNEYTVGLKLICSSRTYY